MQANPLGKIKLHTLLVGDINNSYNDVATLRSWSTTFKTLDAKDYDIPFAPPMGEMQQYLSMAIPTLLKNMQTVTDLNRLKNRINLLLQYFEQEEAAVGLRALLGWFRGRRGAQIEELAELDLAAVMQQNQEREAQRREQEELQKQRELERQAELARQEAEKLKLDEEETQRLLQLISGDQPDFGSVEDLDHNQEIVEHRQPQEEPKLGRWESIRRWWQYKLQRSPSEEDAGE